MQWKSSPDRFGVTQQSRLPNEGEYAGVEYDAYTREPVVKNGRKGHSLRPLYSFIEFVNAWLAQDWPADQEDDPEPPQDWKTVRPGDPGWEEAVRNHGGAIQWQPMKPIAADAETLAKIGHPGVEAGIVRLEPNGPARPLGQLLECHMQVNPEWTAWLKRRNDLERNAAFKDQQERQAMHCVFAALGSVGYAQFGQRVIKAYQARAPQALRENPDKSIRHHVAGLARHIGDALVEAVVALADGKAIPLPVWMELHIRGGPVVLNPIGNPPSSKSKSLRVAVFDPVHVLDDLQLPGEIISRSVLYLVGSFYTHLLNRAAGSNESIRRCAHLDSQSNLRCGRIFVGNGKLSFCVHHEGENAEARQRARQRDKERAQAWRNAKGDWSARRGLLSSWFREVTDLPARLIRFQNRATKANPASRCGFDTAMRWWRETE